MCSDVCEECKKPKKLKFKKKKKSKKSKKSDKYELPREAAVYGYGKHCVYTGDDWGGIQHPPMMPGMMPWGMMGGMDHGMMPMCDCCPSCAGFDSGFPMMGDPVGGCASCGGNPGMMPQPTNMGCTACQAGQQPAMSMPMPIPATPQSPGGTCASCGPTQTPDSFYSPMGPGQNSRTPSPVPPAIENAPNPGTSETPNNEQSSSGPIQKLNWVPRQL